MNYGNLGSFDYKVTNIPQYDLEADLDKAIKAGLVGVGNAKTDYAAQQKTNIANQLALDKIDQATRQGLILKSDDDAGALNNSRIDFSNMLIDRLNQAKISRDNGLITPADYSKVAMTLESQIKAYQDAEKVLYGGISGYMELLDTGNLSAANDPEAIEFWSAMATGRADVKWEYDENNKMELAGTWTDAEGKKQPIRAAIEKFEQLPFALGKPEMTAKQAREHDTQNILNTKSASTMSKLTSRTGSMGEPLYETDISTITQKNINGEVELKPWFTQMAQESFDGYFNSLGNGDLRAGLKQYLLDSEEGFGGYATVNNIIESRSVEELNHMKTVLENQYAEDLKNDVIAANDAKVKELNSKANGNVFEQRKDELNLRKLQAQTISAERTLAKDIKGDSKVDSDPRASFTPTQNKLYNFYSSVQDAMSSFAPNPLNPSEATTQIDQKKLGEALKQTMGITFGESDDKKNFTFYTGTKTFNNSKTLNIPKSQINSPALLLQRIGESFTDPDTKQPIDYNTILSIFRQRNKLGY